MIQDWLNLIEISWTVGTSVVNWQAAIDLAKKEAEVFYDEVDEFGEKRPGVGWTFLSTEDIFSGDEEEEEESDSEYNSEEEQESESEDGSLIFNYFLRRRYYDCYYTTIQYR